MLSRNFITEYLFPILDEVSKEHDLEWGEVTQNEDPSSVLRIHFMDSTKHSHLSHAFDLSEYHENRHALRAAFENEVERVLWNWRTRGATSDEPPKPNPNKYFRVKLLGEAVSRVFEYKCNDVLADPNYLVCNNIDDDGVKHIIALFPHHRVEYVICEELKEESK